MSILSEQVKELRRVAETFHEWEYNRFYDAISRAADTIESLYAKLQAANMENGGGWIYCGDGKNLPKEKEWYMTTCVVGSGDPFSTELYFDGAKFDTDTRTLSPITANGVDCIEKL